MLSYSRREPLGVVGAIIPWNAPVGLGAMKIAPALCTGNTLVLKAAEDAPLGVLMIAEICQRFLPPSVLNVLTGYGEEAGAALSRHPAVRKLSFTGSTEVGKLIMREASERLVPVSLELGGKSPSIVYPDVGCEDWVVDGIGMAMRFTRQSQSCTAGSRLFLHEDIFDAFLEAAGGEDLVDPDRGPPRRSDGHGRDHQPDPVRQGVRLRGGRHRALRRAARHGRPSAHERPLERRLLRGPHRLRRRVERLAHVTRGDLRPGAGRDPLERRGGGDPHGQRHPLRPRRLRVVARRDPGVAHRARGRGGLGAGQPGHRPDPRAVLRRA